jgi:dihydrofolate synthase/folylpolyglutamate synthase
MLTELGLSEVGTRSLLQLSCSRDYKLRIWLMKPLRNYQDFENFLSSFTNYERQATFPCRPEALRPGRMVGFLEDIGNPHREYSTVHIAGSKGKGTTALILEALLEAEGLRTGTYTSPHVEELRERIRVAGKSVTRTDLCQELNHLLPALGRRHGDAATFPTFFELMTALAMAHFARRRVDWAIFEVGLGGRLDATNVLSPRWSAITSVGLEHTRVLGGTLAEIAREKAGIIKPETPAVLGSLPPAALEVILEVARERRAEIHHASPDSVRPGPPGQLLIAGFRRPVPCSAVRGPALRADLAVALRLHRGILGRAGRAPRREHAVRALGQLRLPARVEVFDGKPPVVLDGAHTAESFESLRLTLEEIRFPAPRTLVLSVALDKRLAPILREARQIASDFILTRADALRSVPPADLRSQLGRGTVVDDPVSALELALERNQPVVVSGSVYLAGAVRPWLRRRF